MGFEKNENNRDADRVGKGSMTDEVDALLARHGVDSGYRKQFKDQDSNRTREFLDLSASLSSSDGEVEQRDNSAEVVNKPTHQVDEQGTSKRDMEIVDALRVIHRDEPSDLYVSLLKEEAKGNPYAASVRLDMQKLGDLGTAAAQSAAIRGQESRTQQVFEEGQRVRAAEVDAGVARADRSTSADRDGLGTDHLKSKLEASALRAQNVRASEQGKGFTDAHQHGKASKNWQNAARDNESANSLRAATAARRNFRGAQWEVARPKVAVGAALAIVLAGGFALNSCLSDDSSHGPSSNTQEGNQNERDLFGNDSNSDVQHVDGVKSISQEDSVKESAPEKDQSTVSDDTKETELEIETVDSSRATSSRSSGSHRTSRSPISKTRSANDPYARDREISRRFSENFKRLGSILRSDAYPKDRVVQKNYDRAFSRLGGLGH